MKDYLGLKGIVFEDERLKWAINMCLFCKHGGKTLRYLLDNLNDDVIDVINSRQAVKDIKGNDGYKVKVNYDENVDASFTSTLFKIQISKDNMMYDYWFNLSFFHNKADYNDIIGEFNTLESIYDSNGKFIMDVYIDPYSTVFGISTDKKMSGYIGVCTSRYYDGKKSKEYRRKVDIERILAEIRENLKDRSYYQTIDREYMKLNCPERYQKYMNEYMVAIGKYKDNVNELADVVFDIAHGNIDEDDNPYMLYNVVERRKEELYLDALKKKKYYEEISEYCDDDFITYEEWVKIRSNRIGSVVSMSSVPVNENCNKNEYKYMIYNPNKQRYEDIEDEEIEKKKKR